MNNIMNVNANNLNEANDIIDSLNGKKKVVRAKNNSGLMEKAECCEKVILMEDNRQLILD